MRAYVTNAVSNTVSVINTTSNTVVDTIPVADGPSGIAVTPDGGHAYVTREGADAVSVIDTASNTVGDTTSVGVFPHSVALSPDGSRAYVTNFVGNTISVIDTTTNTVLGTAISVSGSPYGIAVSPDGQNAYVTHLVLNGTVSVVALTPPVFSAAPDPVDFADQRVGTTSAPSTVTVTNTGTSALTFGAAAVTLDGANKGAFAISDDTCSNSSVAVADTCTVKVSFSPASTGAKTADLTFTSNAPDSPDTVTVNGTGVQVPMKTQRLATQLPTRIKVSGLTLITPANTRTNAGQRVRTIVRGGPKKPTAAGEVRSFTVIRGANGRTSVRTYGKPNLRLVVVQRARATQGYSAFTRTTKYTNGKRN